MCIISGKKKEVLSCVHLLWFILLNYFMITSDLEIESNLKWISRMGVGLYII